MTMTFPRSKWASGKDGRSSSMTWGAKPRRPEYVPPYGTDLYVGPKGAGKSLLAIHRARLYHEGKKRLANGYCVCGDIECDGKVTAKFPRPHCFRFLPKFPAPNRFNKGSGIRFKT